MITRGRPTSVFSLFHYITYSSKWAFAYQLPPVVNPPEELAMVQYAEGFNGRGALRSPVLIGLRVNINDGHQTAYCIDSHP